MFVVEVKNIYFSYGGEQNVLEDVSFRVSEGEFVGIVGPNGSGKTTLLKAILGLLKVNKGEIKLFGSRVYEFKDWNRVGYVPQKINVEKLFPATVKEILSSFGDIKHEVLEILHVEDLLHKQFVKLSGGQQQRILLALALMKDPDLIILDEPTTGLDLHVKDHIMRLLRDLVSNENKSVLMVSHDINLLLKVADKVLCLDRKVTYFGEVENSLEAISEIFGIPLRLL